MFEESGLILAGIGKFQVRHKHATNMARCIKAKYYNLIIS